MPGAVFLEGENVNLRTVEEEDLEFLRDYYNHPEIRKAVMNNNPVNLEQERDFLEEVVKDEESIQLLIFLDKEPIGMIGVEPMKDDGVGELGIWLIPEQHGNGYGPEASEILLDHLFKQHLQFHKVIARVHERNKPSQKVWERLGFTEEGTLRKQVYHDGEYIDVHLYGIAREEWN